MQVELDDFEDGRPMMMKTTQQTADKIKMFKSKKQYKELLEVANSMPNTKQKYLLTANCLLHLKRWKQLSEACDKGLDVATDENQSSDFFNLKGKALGKLGNFQDKVVYTSKAIDINPKVAAYHRNLGAAYYKLKQYEKAIQCHDKAIDIEPKHSINHHNKGAAYFRLKDYQKARDSFKYATQLDKKQIISFAWLADSYKEMGQYERAKEAYMYAYEISDQDDYKKSAKEMQEKISPGKKKGFFSKLFG